jgi:hypothetical protein
MPPVTYPYPSWRRIRVLAVFGACRRGSPAGLRDPASKRPRAAQTVKQHAISLAPTWPPLLSLGACPFPGEMARLEKIAHVVAVPKPDSRGSSSSGGSDFRPGRATGAEAVRPGTFPPTTRSAAHAECWPIRSSADRPPRHPGRTRPSATCPRHPSREAALLCRHARRLSEGCCTHDRARDLRRTCFPWRVPRRCPRPLHRNHQYEYSSAPRELVLPELPLLSQQKDPLPARPRGAQFVSLQGMVAAP